MNQQEQEAIMSGQTISTLSLKKYVKNLEEYLIKGIKQQILWIERSDKFVTRTRHLNKSDKRRILDEIKAWQKYLEAN